ncbi:Putative acetyltransferase yjgM [Escherichia coli]
MTSIQQRAELHRQIWQIANDVRGSVDGWDFKQYVLGALFGNDSNLLIVFYVQIMPDDFVMQLHRF